MMAEATTAAVLEHLPEIVRQIVRRFRPTKVILFGSYAYGQPHEGSDLDLLVITANPPPQGEQWKVAREFSRLSPVPVQLVFMSPETFEETRDVVGGLAYPAHHWGKVLYEANT